jgi:hypothetical protein
MKIDIGETVILVLHSPREKLFGILDEMSPAGIGVRALELGYFDDLCKSIAADEPHLGLNDLFIPMWRVERMTRDERTGEMPSMAEQFHQRTGRELGEF